MSESANKNFRKNKEYKQGIKAYLTDKNNDTNTNNPYTIGSNKYNLWEEGYTDKMYNIV